MVAPNKSSHNVRSSKKCIPQIWSRPINILLSSSVIILTFAGLWSPIWHSDEDISLFMSNSTLTLELLVPVLDDSNKVVTIPPKTTITPPRSTNGISNMQLTISDSKVQNKGELTLQKNNVDMSSVTVLDEKDFVKDYSKQKEFQGTFFDSAPPCNPVEKVSFTLVTQASMDRIWIMKHHCERWPPPHPISIAIYLSQNSTLNEIDVAHQLHIDLDCDISRMKVLVMKGNSPMESYPINMLRNLAMRSATTTHVVYTDSDFLISEGLYDDLMAMAPIVAEDPLAAIVLPAFVYHTACPDKFNTDNQDALNCLASEWETGVPKTKEDLIPLWEKPRIQKPNVKSGFHGVHFHGSTMYEEFKNQTAPLLIPCISHWLYEPYLAVRLCEDLPEFPEVFRGYGWNKNVWIMWLTKKRNYKLWQSPRGFVFHLPHRVSPSWWSFKKPDQKTGKKRKTPPEMELYLEWFKRKVPRHPDRIPSCSDLEKKKLLDLARNKTNLR